ncbi:MAG: Anti-sigma-D factor RsdA to sigma factor binding region [Frankiaceae bacterium]|nr:Anti-sigma-D factor RsdA to sigma factor binding region [Frankiaceae bacterium]
MTDELSFPDDLAAVAADDALVDALGSAELFPVDRDAVAGLLTMWRSELDEAVAAGSVGGFVQRHRWSRARRNTAGFIAGVVALAATTGVAAAASGPSGPGPLGDLHRAIWGGSAISPTAHDSATTAQVTRILDEVAGAIQSAQAAGGITALERTRRNGQLDDAAALLEHDPAAPAGLRQRVDTLRAQLAALAPVSKPGPRNSGSEPGGTSGTGNAGSDNTGTDDGSASSGSGHDGGGGDDGGSGTSHDGGSTDDATDGGSDGSGSGGGGSDDSSDSSGTDSGSGSDDGSSTDSGSGTDDSSGTGSGIDGGGTDGGGIDGNSGTGDGFDDGGSSGSGALS